jgi:hypothetical protein
MTLTVKDENDAAKNLTNYTGKWRSETSQWNDIRNPLYFWLRHDHHGGTGEVALSLSKTETAALNFRNAVYDLYIESAAGTRTYLLKGAVTVEARITQ